MRIAFLYDCIYPYIIGGVERRTWEMGRRLAARGHEVHLLGMKFWDGPQVIEREGVRIHGVSPAAPLYTEGKRAILPAARYALSLLPHLLLSEFDLIDAQQFPYLHCFSAAFAGAAKRVPMVITWHEVWGSYWREYLGAMGGRAGEMAEWLVAHLAAPRAAVSRTTADQLRALGVREQVEVIPNGIDIRGIAAVSPAPVHWDLLSAGRLIPEKRIDLLIDAIPALLDEFPTLRVLILGEGPARPDLEQLASRLGIGDHVSFDGFLADPGAVTGLMKSSGMYVSPSVREGFGMAALEAMACGIPVVTVDHPRNAVRERITPSTGRIARLDPEDLAEKIRECLEDPGRFREGCTTLAARYDWDLIVPQAERFYERVISG
jgi:glycosyltransferase involved in cell wall biosynthesis